MDETVRKTIGHLLTVLIVGLLIAGGWLLNDFWKGDRVVRYEYGKPPAVSAYCGTKA